MTERENDPGKEGHTKEWQDRARVVLNAGEDAQKDSSDKQSPLTGEGRNAEEQAGKLSGEEARNDDPVY